MNKPNIKILVCYNRDYPVLKTGIFTPIHAGRACAPVGASSPLNTMIGDDTGINISEKNPHFNELTATYWAWKNPERLGNPTHVGLHHYRRIFSFRNRGERTCFISPNHIPTILYWVFGWSDKVIERTCRNLDVIIPTPMKLYVQKTKPDGKKVIEPLTIYQQYGMIHHKKDLDILLDVVAERYPSYKEAAKRIIYNNTETYFYNIFIMRRDIFERYAQFVFDILLEAEKRIDITGYDSLNSRVFGFLAERLMPIFIDRLRAQEPAVRIEEKPVVFMERGTVPSMIRSIVRAYVPSPVVTVKRKLDRMFRDSGY